MKKITLLLSAIVLGIIPLLASPKNANHYNGMDGKSGEALWDAVHTITNSGFKSLGYDGLWSAYPKTDVYPQGHERAGQVWDMYGECASFKSGQCGSYSKECDCYNREHSIPKSWFGGSTAGIGCDIFHLVPTDGKVNGMRSNYAFGEVDPNSASYKYNGNLLGTSDFEGYSGKVFEPLDQYKGDFARGYMGTIIKWERKEMTSGDGGVMFTGNYTAAGGFGLTQYSIDLLMRWHRQDPVSQKEIDRNDGIEATQGNRNPFIDYPYLAEYFWGVKKNETLDMDDLMASYDEDFIPGKSDGRRVSTDPELHVSKDKLTFLPILAGKTAEQSITVSGDNLTSDISIDVKGDGFSANPRSISLANAEKDNTIVVTFAPTTAGTYEGSLTISSEGAESMAVALRATCSVEHDVKWMVNGKEYTVGEPTTRVVTGNYVEVLPTAPTSCDENSEQFVGWTATPIVGSTDEVPADLFSDETESPRIMGNATFHAVFAHMTGDVESESSIVFEEKYNTETVITDEIAINENITVRFTDGSSATKYYPSGAAIRVYGGGTMTISSESEMTSIEILFGTSDKTNTITVNTGEYEQVEDPDASNGYHAKGKWTGEAEDVTFTVGGTSGHRRFAAIKVNAGNGVAYSRFITSWSCDSSTAIESVSGQNDYKIRKCLKDGRVLLEIDGQLFDLLGQRVK